MKQTLLKSALAGTLIASAVVVAGAQRHATKQDVQRQLPASSQRATQGAAGAAVNATAAEKVHQAAGNNVRPQLPVAKAVRTSTSVQRRADSPQARIYFAINPQDTKLHEPGAYWVDIDDPQLSYHRIGSSTPNSTKGGVAVDDIYYATQTYNFPMRDWTVLWNLADSLNFTGTIYDGVYQLFANDAAYDPWTDRIIGAVIRNYGKSTYSMGVIDYDKHSKEFFGPEYAYGTQLMSVAAGPDCYWGIDYSNNFVRIDKFTGDTTFVGKTGVNANIINGASMIYEPRSKKLYYSANDNSRDYLSGMYTIDPATGVASPLWLDSISERRTGLWVDELTTSACPGLATDLSCDFAVGSLTGKVKFTAPAKTWGGNDGSGSLTYTILANGRQVATGTTSYGTTQDVDVSIPGPGTYKFSVKTENAAGPSRWARLEAALGFEKPGKPAPGMTYEEGKFTVSWTPVALSASGAPMDTAYISYKVTRMPDSVLVADELRDTVFVDNFTPGEQLATYYYGVQAVYGGVAEGDAGLSNTRTMGHILAPWEEVFADHKRLDAFTIIDANGDKDTWYFDSIYGHQYLSIWSASQRKDDWLISPPVKMDKEHLYRINYTLSNLLSAYNPPEKMRILLGQQPTVAGMTTLVADTIEVCSPDWVRIGDYVRVDAEGDYYFGLHAVTGPEGHRLSLRDVSVSEPVSVLAPDYVTEARIQSSYNDPSNVDITFTTPTLRADGTGLESISKLEVMRGDTLVVTYANPRPGTPIHCTDMVGQRGRNYIYSIVAYNEAGRGKELVIEDFIGIRKPGLTRNVAGWENNGKVTLTWEAPATDEMGNALNPDNVTYDVAYRINEYTVKDVAKDLKANTITFDYAISDPSKPEFLVVSVTARTEGGDGAAQSSYPIACGNAHSVPLVESFAGGRAMHPVGVLRLSGDAEWHLYGDNSFSDLQSYDRDGGMVGMQAQNQGAKGLMSFAKIDMTKMRRPVLTFFTYNITGNAPDDNEYSLLYNDGTGFRTIHTAKVSDCAAPGWNKVTVPLTELKGKTVQLAMTATTRTYVYSLFDNFRIAEQLADNLAIGDFSAPAAANANQEVAFTVKVENNGDNDARDFRIDLYRDGKVFMQKEVNETLASGSSAIYTIPATFTTVDPDQAMFMAELSYDKDMDVDDNMSDEKTVSVIKSNFPVPTAFNAEENSEKNAAVLSWGSPQLGGSDLDPVTEGFEAATPWNATQAGEWTLVNRDGKQIGGANGITFPGGIQGAAVGFFTFRYGDDGQFNETWKPYSGSQMLVSVYAKDASKSDDWAISPELSGKAQTVSLRARSYDQQYLESFRIMYSTTDTDPASFKEAKAFNNISKEWTLYSADLPAGAKYMAINGVSQDKFMLFIDDISYVPGGDLQLKGYNVYRDGVRVNTEPVAETRYTDAQPDGGDFGYQVTAMYDRGESRPTELKTVHVSSVNVIPEGVEVAGIQGAIVIRGTAGMPVKVTNAAGLILYVGDGQDTLRIPAARGVYMVTVRNATVKVIVK